MGIQFPPIAFLYLLYSYFFLYLFILFIFLMYYIIVQLVKNIIKLKT